MKPKPFSKLWTKRTVQIILKEYEASDGGMGYLCYTSQTFYVLWVSHKLAIQKLALKFDPSDKILQGRILNNDGSCLFYATTSRAHRIAFLQHEIARLTPKKRKSTK
jgi:hypothetical protein